MKKNKAFTLIELLAVIIILAIVALIATPIIINIIDDVRKEGFKQTALGYYNAAEYVYDEMFLGGKTENIQFTFEDGKQTSSNENYKLEVRGESPKGGLVYLTKDGNVVVSISNNKYCAYVDENKEIILSEDITNCGYTPVPEGCYSIENRTLSSQNKLDGSEEWMTKNYNMLNYNYNNESCPTEFNILILPSEVDGQKVEGIGTFGNKLTGTIDAKNVIMPSGLKVIDYMAFHNTNRKKQVHNVIIPEGVIYIGSKSFARNPLQHIDIPDSVTYLGERAFYQNQLIDISLPSNIAFIGDYAFYGNQFTNLKIPDNIQSINVSAFGGMDLKYVSIGNIKEFSLDTFFGSTIEKLIIGEDESASISLSPRHTGNNSHSINIQTLILGNGVKSIQPCALHDVYLENVVIEDGISELTISGCMGSESIENLTIGQSGKGNIKIIKVSANIKHLVLGDSVTDIGAGAFSGCGLTSAIIPNGITSINAEAFYGNKLASINIPNSVISIGSYAFSENGMSHIVIPNGVTSIDESAFSYNKLAQIMIPSSVTSIGQSAFANNQFPNRAAITIEGDSTRFNDNWSTIGFPE